MWGVGKADVLRREGASIYVGDHIHDVEGALAAGALSVSVLTGGCTREELEAAGTHVVLDRLGDFPAWLDEHLLQLRLDALEADLRERGSVLVAYSGGADSAFLLAAAVRALGPENVGAATGYSHSLPLAERDPAREFAESLGVQVLTPETHEMEREGYRANGADRCYFCKAELLDVLAPLAAERGFAHVATGTNADDAVAGFRPGIRAAAERGAIAPLRDAGLTKAQIRGASRRWDLPTWDKPAAACLSSRVAYGVEVTPYRLGRVERAEVAVRQLLEGFARRQPAGARPRRPGIGRARRRAAATASRDRAGPGRRRAGRRLRGRRDRPARIPFGFDERGSVGFWSPWRRATRAKPRRGHTVPTGKVKWYDAAKGFGFLSQEDGPDVYVHSDALPDGTALKPGTRVEFGIAQGRRGDQALQVKVLDAPASVVAQPARRQAQAARRDGPDRRGPDPAARRDRRGLPPRAAPGRATAKPVAKLLRALADELEA